MESKRVSLPSNIKHLLGLCLLTLLFIISGTSATTSDNKNSNSKIYKSYLRTSCNSTTYPSLCYKSLQSYTSTIKTNQKNLCNMALNVNVKSAKATSSSLAKLAKQKGMSYIETAIVKDCVENIGDAIDELRESLDEMHDLGGVDAEFHMSNLKTWISAALTEEDTCTEGLEGRKVSVSVKNTIKKSIMDLAKMTSNTLSLINNLSY